MFATTGLKTEPTKKTTHTQPTHANRNHATVKDHTQIINYIII